MYFQKFLKKDYLPRWGQEPNPDPGPVESYDKNIYNLSQLTKFQNTINSIDIFQKIIYMIKNNYLNKDFKTESRNDSTNIQIQLYSFINR